MRKKEIQDFEEPNNFKDSNLRSKTSIYNKIDDYQVRFSSNEPYKKDIYLNQ